ncbi:FG-GAP-like repeat-containing protein, partial [Patescibacteria group bacterium]|nr:FG-GAP-like repeat-containing protein [Patescibacteria group bacterium]
MDQKFLFKKITAKNITAYQKRLADELKLSPATDKRRVSSIRKFCDWTYQQGYLTQNPFLKETETPGVSIPQNLSPKANVFQKAYRTYSSLSITKYFHYAILIIFCAVIGFGAYDQFFKKTPTPLAYPASPVTPNRYLSFQGRLTDSSNNPISGYTDITFKLWKTLSGGTEETCTGDTGEDCLWTSGSCTINSDQDGIFSLLLGTESGPEYECLDAEGISEDVFTKYPDIWLAITVDDDGEMDPRMQVATVGYALNAETLQGLPPGTGVEDIPFIPYINSEGKLVIAVASPSIQATSGTFALEGQTGVTIQAGSGQNGSIALAPKGTGTVNLTSEATTGNLLDNQGGVNFGTEGGKEANNLYYGYVGLDTTNFNLLKLEAGETPSAKFTVDASGNASAAGILKALTTGSYFTGDVTVSGGDITGANSVVLDIGEASADYITSSVGLAVGGAQTYFINTSTSNLNALTLAGDLTIDTNDFFVDFSENKIGIGTTTLTERLTLAGNATISGTLALAPNVQVDAGTCNDVSSAGKMYYDGDANKYYFCNGSEWTEMGSGSGTGDSWWTEALGLLYPVNETLDLAIGGTSTASANVKLGASSESDSFIYGGSLGIGTRDPGATLEVVGTTILGGGLTGAEEALSVNTGAAFSGNLLKLAVNGTQKLAIDSTGMLTTASGVFTSTVADGGSAIGFKLITPEYTTSGAKLFSVFNDTDERFSIDKDGVGTFYGDGTGSLIDNTSGDITIDAAGGNINLSGDNLINVGSLGIGTTEPGAELDVVGDILVQGGGTIDTRAAGTLTIGGTTQTGLTLGRSGQSTTLAGNVQGFTLAGNITGSGTPNITDIGQFSGSTAILSSTGDALTLSGAGANINFSGAGLAQILTAASQDLALMPGGNVGIGTTDPSAKLDIVGDLEVNGYATVSSSLAVGYTDAPAGPGNAIFSGNVGIGTTDLNYKLDVAGTINTRELIAHDISLSSLSTSIINAQYGYNGYTNFTGGIGTGGIGKDSILEAQRLTSTGNLINLGSIQAGEMLLTKGGTFAAKADYATGSHPLSVAMGDLNGDGKADLAVANAWVPSVSVFINNGNGTFAAKADYDTGDSPQSVAMGDLNGDGKADLAVTNTSSNKVSVFINNASPILYAQASSGNVGIGTTDPSAKLDIVGDLEVNGYATVSSSLAVGYNNAPAGPGNAIFSGSVGIGTTGPDSKLEINASSGEIPFKVKQPGSATETLRPNADGDVIELYNSDETQVDNWSYVDEVVADDDTTIVLNFTDFSAKLDLYNLPGHSGSGIINKITVYARIKSDDEIEGYARIAIKTGGTVYYSGNLTTAGTTWENKSYEWATNHKTELAWTWNDIDSLQIGIELYNTDLWTYCTQLYVEVDYIGPLSTTFIVDSSGNVGIGTTNPVSKFQVEGTNTGKPLITLNETGTDDILNASVSGTLRTKIDNNGYFDIYSNYSNPSNYEQGQLGYQAFVDTANLNLQPSDESKFLQEDLAYSTVLTPSAISGEITLTLGSGDWNTNSKIKAGCRVVGNGGIASLIDEPTASSTINAYVDDSFNNTDPIASNEWQLYCTEFDPLEKLVLNSFLTDYGSDLTYGNAETFKESGGYGSIDDVSAVKIDTDKVLIAYHDESNGDFGTAIVGSVSGTTISWGEESTFNSNYTEYISAAPLGTNKVIIAYYDDDDYGNARVASVSETTITYGTEATFNDYYTYSISAAQLTTDKAIIAYEDNNGYGNARVASV